MTLPLRLVMLAGALVLAGVVVLASAAALATHVDLPPGQARCDRAQTARTIAVMREHHLRNDQIHYIVRTGNRREGSTMARHVTGLWRTFLLRLNTDEAVARLFCDRASAYSAHEKLVSLPAIEAGLVGAEPSERIFLATCVSLEAINLQNPERSSNLEHLRAQCLRYAGVWERRHSERLEHP